MATQITVRGVPEELARRIAKLAEVRKQSVNTTVLQLLERATGIDGRRERLAQYTTWTDDDVHELDQALALQRTVDDSRWK